MPSTILDNVNAINYLVFMYYFHSENEKTEDQRCKFVEF